MIKRPHLKLSPKAPKLVEPALDASEAHQFVPMDCFDLNELSQEGIIIFILFVIYNSYIT